jgi:hypothetical protein
MSNLTHKIATQMFVSVFKVNPEQESIWAKRMIYEVYTPLAQITLDAVFAELLSDDVIIEAYLPLLNHIDISKNAPDAAKSALTAAITKMKKD